MEGVCLSQHERHKGNNVPVLRPRQDLVLSGPEGGFLHRITPSCRRKGREPVVMAYVFIHW